MTNPFVQTTKWLRQRQLGKQQGKPQTTKEQVMRLKLDKTLSGHRSCVNCLEWNKDGQTLISGSDDYNVILWQNPTVPKVRKTVIPTTHQGNIFSVKFMPNSCEHLIATCAADKTVKVTSVLTDKPLLDCRSCHEGRVKKLGVHNNEPNTLWSIGEDGIVMEYDLRVRHTCKSAHSIMLDLTHFLPELKGKSLANHPMREELIAVGTTNSYVFLFDRRLLTRNKPNSLATDCCTAYFSPGCPTDPLKRAQHLKLDNFPVSNIAFSADGKELLANINKDQIYLFSMEQPDEQYKSFDLSVKHLFDRTNRTSNNDKSNNNNNYYNDNNDNNNNNGFGYRRNYFNFKSTTNWDQLLGKQVKPMTQEAKQFIDELSQKLKDRTRVRLNDFDNLNELIARNPTCVELYNHRASILMHRAWYGDRYQAIRDTCCALALDPLNTHAAANMITCTNYIGELGIFWKLMRSINVNYGDLIQTKSMNDLTEFIAQLNEPTADRERPAKRVSLDEFSDSIFSESMGYPKAAIGNANLWESRADYRFISDLFPGGHRFHPSPDYIHPFDYSKRFCGHCNIQTDIKEASFFGSNQEFVISGSDDGALYIWDRMTTNLVKACQADSTIVNCIQPHPRDLVLATSGIDDNVKLWSLSGKDNCDVMSLETRCTQNQELLNDPWSHLLRMIQRHAG